MAEGTDSDEAKVDVLMTAATCAVRRGDSEAAECLRRALRASLDAKLPEQAHRALRLQAMTAAEAVDAAWALAAAEAVERSCANHGLLTPRERAAAEELERRLQRSLSEGDRRRIAEPVDGTPWARLCQEALSRL